MAEEVKLKVVLNGVETSVSTLNELNEALVQTRTELRNVAVGSEDFEALQKQFSTIDSQLREIRDKTKGVKVDELEATFLKFGETVTSSFALATSALALFGAESEDVAKAQAQAQQLLTIVITAKNLAEIAEGETAAARILIGKAQIVQTTILTNLFGANTVATAAQAAATGTATAAQIALNTAMKANPILLVVAAIGAIVAALALFSDEEEKAAENVDFTNERLSEQQEEIKRTSAAAIEAARLRGELSALDAATEQARLETNRETQKEILRIQQQELEGVRDAEQKKIDALTNTFDFAIFNAKRLKAAQDANAPGLSLTPLENDLVGLVRSLENGLITQQQFYASSLDIQVKYADASNSENAKALNERRTQLNSFITNVQGFNNQLELFQDKNALVDKQYNEKVKQQNIDRAKKIEEANKSVVKSIQDLNKETINRTRQLEFELLQSLARQGKAYENIADARANINATTLTGEVEIQKEILRLQEQAAIEQAQATTNQRKKEIQSSKADKATQTKQIKELERISGNEVINIREDFRIKNAEIDNKQAEERKNLFTNLANEITFGDFNIYDTRQRLILEQTQFEKQQELDRLLLFQETNKGIIDNSKLTYDQILEQAKNANSDTGLKAIINGTSDLTREATALELKQKRQLIDEEFRLRKELAVNSLEIKANEIEQQRQLDQFNLNKQLDDAGASKEEREKLIAALDKKYSDLKIQEAKKTTDEINAYEVDAAKKTNAAKIALVQEYTKLASDAVNAGLQFVQAANQNELNNNKEKYDLEFQANQSAIQNQLNSELDAANKSSGTEEQKNQKKTASIQKFNDKKAALDKATNEKMLKEENKIREKQFKAEKALNITKAIINGAQAITSILAQYPKFDGGFAMAAAIAASVITTAAQVAVISSQEYSPEGQGQAKELTVPEITTSDAASQSGVNQGGFTLFNPDKVNVTSTGGRNAGGAGGTNPLRVYVLESDITDAQRRVKTTVEQASFG